ncbi:hypothetical protein HMPREF1863_00407 [Aedoeadaptatus coxii]|uniref:Uncharacterized protein n=1 Tax=Aedoeadaptatus coxii TaxID=755172 RepID=A0A134AKB4_9FIRM|nr:hypothetical protein HMPREF1863_00407 [Peptoniphilus coxii]
MKKQREKLEKDFIKTPQKSSVRGDITIFTLTISKYEKNVQN